MDKIKEYTNDEITIVWDQSKCTHSAKCIMALPRVYNPKARPWIKIENATSEQLRNQIKTCPSGALTYYENSKGSK